MMPTTYVTLRRYGPAQATVPCEQRPLTSAVLRMIQHPVNTCSMLVLTTEEQSERVLRNYADKQMD